MKNNMEGQNKKSNQTLLTVIAVATLLVAVVGTSFAYFTASVSGNDTASSVIVSTGRVGSLTYSSNEGVTLSNALPGAQSASVTFTVAYSGQTGTSARYYLYWDDLTNNFTTKSDLVYTITGTGTGAISVSNITAPSPSNSGDSTINYAYVPKNASSSDPAVATINGGTTHTYTYYVRFKETGTNQNNNQGKTFKGKLQVSASSTSTSQSEIYYNDDNKSGTPIKPSAE